MSVVYDNATTRLYTSHPQTIAHVPNGVPGGVLISIAYDGLTISKKVPTDTPGNSGTSAITYGGVALAFIAGAADAFNEHGVIEMWALLSNVPPGPQDVVIQGTGGANSYATVITVTAAGTLLTVSGTLYDQGSDITNPSIQLTVSGILALRVAAIWSGHDTPANLTASANALGVSALQFPGLLSSTATIRETTAHSGAIPLGWTATVEDGAMVAVALYEGAAPTQAIQVGRFNVKGTTSYGQAGTFRVKPLGVGTYDQVGRFNVAYPVTANQWTQKSQPTQTLYGPFTGRLQSTDWGRLVWNPTTRKAYIFDRYAEVGSVPYNTNFNNIYSNSIWEYDPVPNTLTLLKVNNWGADPARGSQIYELAANLTDPTPCDRHSYGCMVCSPSRNSLIIWQGAHTNVNLGTVPDEDAWEFDIASRTWSRITYQALDPTLPTHVYEQSAAWDPSKSRMVWLGAGGYENGRNVYGYYPATKTWTRLSTTDPTAPGESGYPVSPTVAMSASGTATNFTSDGHTMVYDPGRNGIWLLGGSVYGSTPVADLYFMDCATDVWTKIPITAGWITPRKFQHMAFDSLNDVIIVFGGVSDADSSVGLGDTWAFNCAAGTWQNMTPAVAPPARVSLSNYMVYDAASNLIVFRQNWNGTGPLESTFWTYRYAGGSIGPPSPTQAQQVGRFYVAPAAGTGLLIPLTANEVLPGVTIGRARTLGPVTVGVPIPRSAAIANVAALGLTGVTDFQFRSLAKWPEGTERWVLVDYQATLAANGIHTGVLLGPGTGNSAGTNLASDAGSTFVVDTVAATFTITKSPFYLVTGVVIGGTSVVTAGEDGVVVVVGGVRYTSGNDSGAATTIEENGPVRCCIKSVGTLKSSGGTRLCEYLVRMHFYKGKTFMRAFVTLKNANSSFPTAFTFDSAEVKLRLASAATYLMSTRVFPTGIVETHPLSIGDPLYVYQGYSAKYGSTSNAAGTYANSPLNPGGSGYLDTGVKVANAGGTLYRPPIDESDYCEGWAAVEDSTGKGVTMGERWMQQMWPSGFEANVPSSFATCTVQLLSNRNSKTGLKFAWGAFETRELFFDFHTLTPASRDDAFYEMQYPLAARASLAAYNEAGAVFGETGLVTEAESIQYFANAGNRVFGSPGVSPSLINIIPSMLRQWAWGQGSGNNQTDFALIDLINWIRTGRGGFLIEGERNSWQKADNAVRHSDGYDIQTAPVIFNNSSINAGAFNENLFDGEHDHWTSIALAYHITGNENFKDAVVDFGELRYLLASGGNPNYYNPLAIFGDAGDRGTARYLRDFTFFFNFTRLSKYWAYMGLMLDALLTSSDAPGGDPTVYGRNRDRGYVWFYYGPPASRAFSDFINVQIHFEMIYQALLLLQQEGDARVAAVEDYMLGLVDFYYNELFFQITPVPGNFGTLYAYFLDQANNLATNPYFPPNNGEGWRQISQGRPMAWAYKMTGDTKYLDRGARTLFGDTGGFTGAEGSAAVNWRTASDYPTQGLMHAELYRGETGWQNITDLTVTILGGGNYQLHWTAPAFAGEYQIRYSDRVIVPWLGFNQATRVYAFPAASFIAWFAATRLASPPTPRTDGGQEQVNIVALNPGVPMNFSVRYAIRPQSVAASQYQQTGRFRVLGTSSSSILGRFHVTTSTLKNQVGSFYVSAAGVTVTRKTIIGLFRIASPQGHLLHKGHRVMTLAPDGAMARGDQIARSVVVIGPDAGRQDVVDLSLVTTAARLFQWTCTSAAEVAALKTFVDEHFGRLVPFWLPTFTHDLTMVNAYINPLASRAPFVPVSYLTNVWPVGGSRRHLAFIPVADPSAMIPRSVLGGSVDGNGNEELVLDAPMGEFVLKASSIVSYLRLCRFAEDRITLTFSGRSYCVATISVVELPNEAPL